MSPISTRICVPNLVVVRRSCRKKGGTDTQTDKGTLQLYIVDCIATGSGVVQWDFVHGLFEYAIYGGRVDNPFDMRVMVSYLQQFFDANVIGRGSRTLGPLNVPSSTSHRVSSMFTWSAVAQR